MQVVNQSVVVSPLRLELLGTAGVFLGQKAVKLGVKPLAMLAIAALGGRISRRELGIMLWADAPNALNNLSVARNTLEKALGKGVLDTNQEFFALQTGFSCDVLEFRNGMAALDGSVWDLWRGAFLTGLRLTDWEMGLGAEFEEWLLTTRETLILERREFAVRLGVQQIRLGDYKAAVTFLKVSQTTDGDPFEDAAQYLMLAFGAIGLAEQAVLVFGQISKLLLEELGVEPSRRTLEALEIIRSKQPEACKKALQLELGQELTAPVPITQVPLIGRESELEQVLNFLQTNQTTVILGEPGAGKTRLALEAMRLTAGYTICLSSHQESLGFALLEMLVQQCLKDFPDALSVLAATEQAVLSSLLESRFSSHRIVLFQAIKVLLTHCKVSLLLLDDAQWLDSSSLEFVLFLLERPVPDLRLLLTQRNTEMPRSNINAVLEAHHAKFLALSALSETAIMQMARAIGTDSLDFATLQKRSGGNAFFVLELLRFAPDAQSKTSEMVGSRLHNLSEPARQILEALCIYGLATLAELRIVSGRSLDELNAALEELGTAMLINQTATQIGFAHDIVREVLDQHISASRRSLLHFRATQIKNHNTARHYWEARSVWDEKDEKSAFQAFLELAQIQTQRGDLALAQVWLERSLSLARSPEARAEVFLETANTLESFGRYQEALEELETAQSITAILEPVLQAKLLNTRVWILQREYRDFVQSARLLATALGLLSGIASSAAQSAISQTYNLLGSLEYNNKDYASALMYYQKAQRIRRVLGDSVRLADSLGGLGLVYTALNDSKAEKHLLECLHLRETNGDLHGVSRALTNLGMFYGTKNQFVTALEFQERSLGLQQRFENPTGIAIALNNLGVTYFRLEQFQTAHAYYENAIETLQFSQLPIRQNFYDNLAEVTAKLESLRS